MKFFQKKNPRQEILQVYDELADNLVAIKQELGRLIAIESHIELKLDNTKDDITKVSKALANAEQCNADSDVRILKGKINSLYHDEQTLASDRDRALGKITSMKASYKELTDAVLELQARYKDIDLTLNEARVKELANDSYQKKLKFDQAYKEFEEEAYRKLFTAIAEEELDGKRVSDELTKKYMD